jgi:hypothetical protein
MCQPSRISGDRRPKAIGPEKLLIFNWFLKREKKKGRPEMVYHRGRIGEG